MYSGSLIRSFTIFFVIAACFTGTVAAASLGIDWRQAPMLADNVFSGVTITPDASKVYSGGSQLLVRSWDGDVHWGGQAGFIADMSADGNYVVTSSGNTVTLLNVSGIQVWSRNMEGTIKAVAVAPNASFVISVDDKGNYNSWASNGEFIGRNKTDVVKQVAIAPGGDLVVATTDAGIRFFTSSLEPVWTDSRAGSLDTYIVISDDGSTVITAGGSRVSSHTRKGAFNWQFDVSDAAINDIACSQDCSIIVVGSQDNTVRAIDRYGKVHWTYKTGQWANAVSVSRSGSVIAVGANDGTVLILNNGGRLQTQRKFDSRIQPRSIAVSSDGSKVVAADQYYLYGLTLSGISPTETTSDTVFVAATLNPVRTAATTVATTAPVVEETVEETTAPTPLPTKQSPVGVWITIPAVAGALCLIRRPQR
ncbi:MAG: hypothetical protein M0R30_00145 [Methanoregula sp.]|uniref:WD40 repeat domain-containing protein n=1 Tax=Methanoregula sp. TaxID=2052170 RepID=UPI0025E21348|nr:hypothetical protein [Methanoregula sp.]MCK9630030.1 hypothetical protein [Methanoregula sp.]